MSKENIETKPTPKPMQKLVQADFFRLADRELSMRERIKIVLKLPANRANLKEIPRILFPGQQ